MESCCVDAPTCWHRAWLWDSRQTVSSKHNMGTNKQRGDVWKGIPFCVSHVALCLGLKSSDDLFKKSLSLCGDLLSDLSRRPAATFGPQFPKSGTENRLHMNYSFFKGACCSLFLMSRLIRQHIKHISNLLILFFTPSAF